MDVRMEWLMRRRLDELVEILENGFEGRRK